MKPVILLLIFSLVFSLSAKEKNASLRSVCLLKSPAGSGSGFFTSIQGNDVLITNNHVILEMDDVKILDINGKEYTYDAVYASQKQDLAVIPVRRSNHKDLPNLVIHPSPDRLIVNAKVIALGDSLGDGVIVETPGKYLGIGPLVLEVDAPFVPGNSGGPVILASSRKVIGVATYCHIITRRSAAETGSRFEVKNCRPRVRRFATRIDRLNPADFQKVHKEEIRQDLARCSRIVQTHQQLITLERTRQYDIEKWQQVLRRHTMWELPEHWNTAYMREETRKKLDLLIALRNLLLPREPVAVTASGNGEKIRTCWKNVLPDVRIYQKKKDIRKCIYCNGIGKVRHAIRKDPRKLRPPFVMRTCPVCSKTGKVQFGKPVQFAVPPPEFCRQLEKLITPEPKSFCSFRIGTPLPGWPQYYRDRKMYTEKNGIFTVCRFYGNHRIPQAKETRFWLVGRLLMRMDVLLPAGDREQANSIQSETASEYAGTVHAKLNMKLLKAAPEYKRELYTAAPGRDEDGEYASAAAAAGQDRKRTASSPQGLQAVCSRIIQIQKAALEDPFGLYYTVHRSPYAAPEIEKTFLLQISLVHEDFPACRELIRIQNRKSLFSDGKP